MKKANRLLLLIIIFIMCLGILGGCGTPKGYVDRDSNYFSPTPFSYSDEERIELPRLYTQFPEFEAETLPKEYRKTWFSFSGEKYYLFERPYPNNGKVSIYKEAEIDEKIGDFVDIRKQHKRRGVALYQPFLYEDFLYYHFQIIGIKRLGLSDWIWYDKSFVRYEYYKFDLKTGENEEITLTKFVEALHAIDDKWEINPNYEGEK